MLLLEHSHSSLSASAEIGGEDQNLPFHESNARAPSLEPRSGSRSRSGGPITVLLVEERASVRQAFRAKVSPATGLAVVGEAGESSEVFSAVERLRPDVVVVALRMALRLGLEPLRSTLTARWGSKLLVLLTNRECPFITHVAASGATGYLTEQDSSNLMVAAICQEQKKRGDCCRESGRALKMSRASNHHHGLVARKDTMHLTGRERETLRLVAEGNANKQIAAKFGLSIKTIEKHRQNLMDKLCIHDTATLTRYAIYAGVVQ